MIASRAHGPRRNHPILRSILLGVFEFVIVLVVVTTIGKVVTEYNDRRALPPAGSSASPEAVDALRDEIADMGARLHRLEEERDFYRNLLDAPSDDRKSLQSPPSEGPTTSD